MNSGILSYVSILRFYGSAVMRAETVFSEVVGVKRLAEGAVVRSFVVAFPSVPSFLRSFVVASLLLRCSFVIRSLFLPSLFLPSFLRSLFLRCSFVVPSFLPLFVCSFVRSAFVDYYGGTLPVATHLQLLTTYVLTYYSGRIIDGGRHKLENFRTRV